MIILTIKRCILNRGNRVVRTNDMQTFFAREILHILLIVGYQIWFISYEKILKQCLTNYVRKYVMYTKTQNVI